MEGELEVKGLDVMIVTGRKREKKAANLRWAGERLKNYMMRIRFPQQQRHGGILPGRYGKGMRKWAPNKESTVKQKGHRKVLFRRADQSDLLDGLSVRVITHKGKGSRAAEADALIISALPYGIHIHDGREDMAKREILAWYEGDADWWANDSAKEVLEV